MSVAIAERPTLVVIVPRTPAVTGNGLTMRLAMLVDAAGLDHDVHLVVAPVYDRVAARPASTSATTTQLLPPSARWRRRVSTGRRDPRWRARLEGMTPLPPGVRRAGHDRSDEVLRALGGRDVAGVVACRLVTAPLALAVAEALDVPIVIDADDDDEALLRSLGDTDGAAAHGRLARICLPEADLVLAASARDASALGDRHRLPRVEVAPNAAPAPVVSSRPMPADECRVLMVANLAYAPNVSSARWLVREVLPHLPPRFVVELVGQPSAAVTALAGPRVRVRGWMADLTEPYERACVAVAPIQHGAGTRIKILEAFANRRPMVATGVAADGLEVTDGVHLRLADTPVEFAAAVIDAAAPRPEEDTVEAAAALVATTYAPHTVQRLVADLLATATRTPDPVRRRGPRPKDLEVHDVDDGLVVYDDRAGRVFHLNTTAALAFELASEGFSEQQIVGVLDPAAAKGLGPVLGSALADLGREGLLVGAPGGSSGQADALRIEALPRARRRSVRRLLRGPLPVPVIASYSLATTAPALPPPPRSTRLADARTLGRSPAAWARWAGARARYLPAALGAPRLRRLYGVDGGPRDLWRARLFHVRRVLRPPP